MYVHCQALGYSWHANGAIGIRCKETDLDVSRAVFKELADIDQGRVLMEWSWLENSPVAVS